MIPIYEAISVNSIIPSKIGRNEPWVITAYANNRPENFVVKLFSTQEIESRDNVTNEVLGNVLAAQFSLNVPDIAFIEFKNDVVMNLTPQQFGQFEKADERLKFATKLISPNTSYNQGLPKSSIKKRIEMDVLFAYNNLIRNLDRVDNKPNILLTKKDILLIDHELAFKIENTKKVFANQSIAHNHIFYKHLKKARKKDKNDYFNEFQEYLDKLDIGLINKYIQQLYTLNYFKNQKKIINHLTNYKQNSTTFVNSLRQIIQ
jgi:hypothetical protein